MNTTTARCSTPTVRVLCGALLHQGTVSIAVASMTTAILSATPARVLAADDDRLQRMATCAESWLDWKNDAGRLARYVDDIEGRHLRSDDGAGFAPRTSTTAFGLPVEQVFPQSVGMGLGFSLLVRADFATTKHAFEKQFGKAMSCTMDRDGSGCELKLGDRKTAVLMADDPKQKQTLLGCFYDYEG